MTRWQNHRDPAHLETVYHPLPESVAALQGTRIVQISDLHIGRHHRADMWAAHIQKIEALRPDLVVITGDAMDWSRRYEQDYFEPLKQLQPRHGVLAILGNHDFYFGDRRMADNYGRLEQVQLLRAGDWSTAGLPGLRVWGMDDPMSTLSRPARYPMVKQWSTRLRHDEYNLLLSHRPDAFRYASRAGFDLQLSGHTHGGQIALGKYNISRVVMGPWDRGLYEREHPRRQPRLYVNRGLGYAGLPYRHDCHSEITLHVLGAAGESP